MAIFSILILLIIAVILVSIIAVLSLIAYTSMYNKRIARQLNSGSTSGRQWPAPKTFVMVFLIIIFFITGFILIAAVLYPVLSVLSYKNHTDNYVSESSEEIAELYDFINPASSFVSYNEEDINGTYYEIYTSAIKNGSLTGYTLEEVSDGNFHHRIYRSSLENDIMHPSFIIATEYIGSEDYNLCGIDTLLSTDESNSIGTGAFFDKSSCYYTFGNIDFEQDDASGFAGKNFYLHFALYKNDELALKDSDFVPEYDSDLSDINLYENAIEVSEININ